MTQLVLLDRDGVLNVNREDHVKTPDELVIYPQTAAAIKILNDQNIKTAIVTNQSGIARGWTNEKDLAGIHQKLKDHLAKENAHIDLILYCPDAPDSNSPRRKPNPGMLQEALDHFQITAENAMMVGDSMADYQAAARLGVSFALVKTGHGLETKEKLAIEKIAITPYDHLYDFVTTIFTKNI